MNFGIVVFPGSNCDRDCYYVIKEILNQPVRFIWHQETDLNGIDCVILPGGFSYGDYLRAGAIARFSPVMSEVKEFADRGGLIVGICNGFQILTEAGLLPGALGRNKGLKFICRYVSLRVERNDTPFTTEYRRGDIIRMPIAHNEGNYYIDNPDKIRNQVVLRYYGENPNGAIDDIAGIVNERGNVFGLMPHPERCSEKILGSEDGLKIFKSIVRAL
ncbi:MAG TPA: phosphoribosylformylglycinamidine synthase subunit PurQ [bacterium]|nr:phosphoribosylformylglycinamidine synthase subunit PurQ [bacterium]HPO81449.1 phosphoribosylformylglycinamidine synthase subunit PurQ [bacterium]HRR91267.1 phosphoribosylformylglycinamidine synthase subunit PurQ [bacterium]